MPKSSVRAVVVASLMLLLHGAAAAQSAPPPLLEPGNAVVTGFSGTFAPDPNQPRPPGKSAIDLTFIDPDGASARVLDISRPGATWDAAVFDPPDRLSLPAKTVGQVFGVAIDDAPAPNVYLAATSAFGLNIVGRGPDGAPERRKGGGPGTGWMAGQFGTDLQGGPGSIYKVDGTTRAVTLFAEVMLNGAPNPGPALGGIVFDAAHRQLLVADLYTGMVHRFAVADGSERGQPYDHGTTGRAAAGLSPVPFDPGQRPNIASTRFKADDPATWGYAPPDRRVWGLAIHDGRLFYSARNGAPAEGPQVWSVGLRDDGSLAGDARIELTVPARPGPYPVTDIVFSQQGAMILAQRAPVAASYDYSAFTRPGEPRVLRYWLEQPDDPATPGRWIAEPEEYAVGYADTYRNANGGVDLGYGYDADGLLSTGVCEYSLWATGQRLRNAPALARQLEPGGPLLVDGLQGSPAEPVRSFNEPPATSYFIDYDRQPGDARASGHLGGVRILKAPCAPPVAVYGGPGYPAAPPYVVVSEPPVGGGCPWVRGADGSCGYVDPVCPWGLAPDGSCGPVIADCRTHFDPKLCGATDIDLKLEKTAGKVTYDQKTGLWTVTFILTVSNAGNPFAPGNSIAIHDPVPAGMTIVAASGANWACLPAPPLSSGALNCRYSFGPGVFAPGPLPDQLVVTATVKAPGKYQNCGVVGVGPYSGLHETTLANNRDCATVEVKQDPVDVAIAKTGAFEEVKPGPVPGTPGLTFTLTMTNVGPAFAGANAITVSDVVPAGMTFTAITAPADWSCSPAPIAAGGTLSCTYAGTGPAAAGAALGAITIAATTAGTGIWENCADVAIAPAAGTDTNPADNRACAKVEKRPDVAIEKTGTVEAGSSTPVPGSAAVTFSLTVRNVGPAFAGANVITVSDVVPAGLTFTAVTAPADWSCGPAPIATGGTLSCTYTGTGPAAPGAVLGTIAITGTAEGEGPWENCAVVAIAPAAGIDSNLDNNKSCITLTNRFRPVDPPPKVPNLCGVNVIFVVDESGSVGSAAGNVMAALSNAASIFNTNGSQAALIHFSDAAQIVLPMATATYGNISTGYAPLGGTNWEAGLSAALSLLPGPPPATVVIFITDGVPNAYLDGSGATQYTDSVTATNEAIPVVNQLYAAGVPVIGIGIGSLSTHLNALLGGNVHASSFGGLSATLTALAREMCPGLYLSKSISPSFINQHTNPTEEVTVTLNLVNTAGNLTNVVIEDNLPPELTNASAPNATSNPVSTPPTSAVVGDPVVWTIPTLAAGGTATLSFKVKLSPSGPLPTDGSWHCIDNYTQVTGVGSGAVSTVANNMANAETGPVHEADEARARVCLQDYVPPDPVPCTTPRLWVKKTPLNEVCRPSAQGAPESGLPCKFTVTVTAQCTNFNGPVLFGDGMFAGSAAASLPIASITSSPPVSCTWTTGSPATCAAANLNLPLGQSITFTVTLGAPITAGTYRNCFLADGKTPVPTTFPAGYTDVNPGTGSGGGLWGHCANFVVAAPAAMACPQGQSPVAGKGCVAPPPPPPPPPVACPPGTILRGAACVRPEACRRPLVATPDGSCACPQGSVLRGRECVKVEACRPPRVMTAKGSCECPEGSVLRGRECVKVEACRPPRVMTAKGSCECPQGTVLRGGACVKVNTCPRPRVLSPSGACECPRGTEPRGAFCVRPAPKPDPIACVAPAFPNRSGTRCLCPEGYRMTGRSCAPVPRRPVTEPRRPQGPDVQPPKGQGSGTPFGARPKAD